MPLKLAAEAEGVAERTLYYWIERKVGFAAAVTRARAKGLKQLSEDARAGGKGSSAALWFIERRFRDDYGPVQKIILDDGHDLSDNERQAQLEAFRRTVVGFAMPLGPDGLGDSSARADAPDAGEAPPDPAAAP